MIGGVARRRHRFERPAVAAHDLAVGQRDVGPEIHIGRRIEPPGGLADVQRPRQPVRPLGEHFCAGRRLDLRHRRRVIAMRMGDENVGDGFVAHGIEQRRHMGVIVRSRVEDRHFAAADDVAHRALEGERARIVGQHRADARRDVADRIGLEVEALIEGDVVAHAGLIRPARRFRHAGG